MGRHINNISEEEDGILNDRQQPIF